MTSERQNQPPNRQSDSEARAIPADAALSYEELVRLARFFLFFLFPILMSYGSLIAIPLPPYGIPFTLQTLIVILAALSLGPRLGTLSTLVYVIAASCGALVFAEGSTGAAVIMGQTGGYILGFVACQPVVTTIVRRKDKSVRGWGAMITAVLAGHLVIFALGVPWLYFVRNSDPSTATTWGEALKWGMLPFMPGLVVKSAIAVWLGRLAAPLASRHIW